MRKRNPAVRLALALACVFGLAACGGFTETLQRGYVLPEGALEHRPRHLEADEVVVGLGGVASPGHLEHVEGELRLEVGGRLVLVGHLVPVLLAQLGVEQGHGAIDAQAVAAGVGGVVGESAQREGVRVDVLRLFQDDPQTEAIMMIGEIGGTAEEEAAAFIKAHVRKPVVGFICGQTAPPGRRMGHAGAIISGGKGTAAEKMRAMEAAGITTVKSPADMGAAVARVVGRK